MTSGLDLFTIQPDHSLRREASYNAATWYTSIVSASFLFNVLVGAEMFLRPTDKTKIYIIAADSVDLSLHCLVFTLPTKTLKVRVRSFQHLVTKLQHISKFYVGKRVINFRRINTKTSIALLCSFADGSLGSITLLPDSIYAQMKSVSFSIPFFEFLSCRKLKTVLTFSRQVETLLAPVNKTIGECTEFRYKKRKYDAPSKSELSRSMPSLNAWEQPGTLEQNTEEEEEAQVFFDGDFYGLYSELEPPLAEQISRTLNVPADTLKRYYHEYNVSNF